MRNKDVRVVWRLGYVKRGCLLRFGVWVHETMLLVSFGGWSCEPWLLVSSGGFVIRFGAGY